ncbi:uncharacterized protein LOC122013556 [Zingiber officinale]|uniref:uncharacterized protein LOC122013556 n=1 Tax=Zingiber officinale TaxID=94328 RepID=UPI001C4A904F|nr:uncharacterized protein LOC122013556 [Zingiber officinale]
MSSGCKSSLSCIDAHAPVRATYVNLYKWPESDAEFVKSVTSGRRGTILDGSAKGINLHGRRKWSAEPAVVDGFSCRQIYLRSYTFSKKETVPEKTLRCLGRAKERAAAFPFLQPKSEHTASGVTGGSASKKQIKTTKRTRKKKKKACVTASKLREVSYATLYFIFRRLLSCTASVDAVDRGRETSQK